MLPDRHQRAASFKARLMKRNVPQGVRAAACSSDTSPPPTHPAGPLTAGAVPHALHLHVLPKQQSVQRGGGAVGIGLPQPGPPLTHLHAAEGIGAAVALWAGGGSGRGCGWVGQYTRSQAASAVHMPCQRRAPGCRRSQHGPSCSHLQHGARRQQLQVHAPPKVDELQPQCGARVLIACTVCRVNG